MSLDNWQDFEVLQVGKCTGELVWGEERLDISFRVDWVERKRIRLEIEPFCSTSQIRSLAHRLYRGEKGDRRIPFFSIRARTGDGRQLISDFAHITSFQDGEEIYLSVDLVQVEIRSQSAPVDKQEDLLVQYINKTQGGFGHVFARHSLGEVTLSGATAPLSNPGEYTGQIQIDAKETLNTNTWLEATDRLAAWLCQMLSLAHGRLFYWEIRKVFAGNKLLSFLLRPQASPSNMRAAVFPHLNLQPVLDLALASYDSGLWDESGVAVSLSWFLSSAGTSEAGFINVMTAIEHLVFVFTDGSSSSRVVPRGFLRRVLRPRVKQLLEGLVGERWEGFIFTNEHVKNFARGIDIVNRPAFRTRLLQMLDWYLVEIKDLQDDVSGLLRMRNSVVHRGLFPFDETSREESFELERMKCIAEELFVRMVLTMLDYSGRYNSPLYDLEWREFPRVEKAE